MDELSDHPICPMCGEPYALAITKRHRHRVECTFCGEELTVDGNSEVPLSDYRPPFWSDQYRFAQADTKSGEIPAGLGTAMTVIVGGFTLMVIVLGLLSMVGHF